MTKGQSNENIIKLTNYFKILNIDNNYNDSMIKNIRKFIFCAKKSYFKYNKLLYLKRKREIKSLDNNQNIQYKNQIYEIYGKNDISKISIIISLSFFFYIISLLFAFLCPKQKKNFNANQKAPLIEDIKKSHIKYKTNISDSENKNCKIKNLNDDSISQKIKDYKNKKKNKEVKKEYEHNFQLKKVGFKNIGHSCYMNSFLQILLRCPEFLKKLNNYYIDDNKNIIYYLINLSIYPNNTNILKKIKKLMGEMNDYRQYTQNDSQEFGIDLINKIISTIKKSSSSSEESENSIKEVIDLSNISNIKLNKFDKYLKRYYPKENTIYLEDMFQFHESKIKMEGNKVIDIDFETFVNIDLVFPSDYQNKKYNLEDLLKYKYKKEEKKVCNKINIKKVKDSKKNDYFELFFNCLPNFWKSDNSNSNSNNIEYNNDNIQNNKNIKISKKKIIKKFASLPKILIISINRAILGKPLINNSVTFKDTLNMEDFIDEDILKNACAKYKLFAINECYGFSKKSGHYYSYIKISDEWFNFDDNKVIKKGPYFCSEFVVGLYYIKK